MPIALESTVISSNSNSIADICGFISISGREQDMACPLAVSLSGSAVLCEIRWRQGLNPSTIYVDEGRTGDTNEQNKSNLKFLYSTFEIN